MLKGLYDWTMALAARKTAEAWLAVIASIESSVFLVPADALFLPMALAKPAYAYRFALVATIASTLGGIAGYFLCLIAAIAAALLIGLYVLVKYLGTAGTVTSC
jgi:membrane protein YqaA with SNARE-associated domain